MGNTVRDVVYLYWHTTGLCCGLCCIFYTQTDAAAGTLDPVIKFKENTAVVSLLKQDQVERGPVPKDFVNLCKAHIQDQRTDPRFDTGCFTAHSIGSEERRVRG